MIGGGITLNIYGLTNNVGEQGNLGEGTLNFHINRFFFDQKLLVDVGVENAFGWGGQRQYREYITYQRSWYVSANTLLVLKPGNAGGTFGYLSVTAGAGNGYFRRDAQYTKKGSGSFNPFISAATPVVNGTNFVAEWSGYDLGLGIASIPVQRFPVMLVAAITDFAYGEPRFVGSITLPFRLVRRHDQSVRPVGIRAIRIARTI